MAMNNLSDTPTHTCLRSATETARKRKRNILIAIPSFWFGAGLDRNGKFVVDPPGDVVAGALGAFPDRDGVDIGGAWWWPNNPAGNAEEWEEALPIMYLYRRERRGSGGAGRWRGGNSLETALVIHKTQELTVQLVSLDNAINCALGLGGGLPSHPGDYRRRPGVLSSERMAGGVMPGTLEELEDQVGALERIFAKEISLMKPGDVFVAQYCGGGGFGDPLTRQADLVASDLEGGAIDPADAIEVYGVVVDGDGVNQAATAERRAALRAQRLASARPPSIEDNSRVEPTDVRGSIGGVVAYGYADDASHRWACPECGQGFGPSGENYKDYLATLERSPFDVNQRQYLDPTEFCDDEFVLRQYLCPACGLAVATEMCKPTDPAVLDVRLTAEKGSEVA